MADTDTQPKVEADNKPTPKSDIELAIDAACAILGYGKVDAKRYVETLPPDKMKQVAEFERTENRTEIVKIFFPPPPAEDKPKQEKKKKENA